MNATLAWITPELLPLSSGSDSQGNKTQQDFEAGGNKAYVPPS